MPPKHAQTEAIIQGILHDVPLKELAFHFNCALTTVQDIKMRHTETVRVRKSPKGFYTKRAQVQLSLPFGGENEEPI